MIVQYGCVFQVNGGTQIDRGPESQSISGIANNIVMDPKLNRESLSLTISGIAIIFRTADSEGSILH